MGQNSSSRLSVLLKSFNLKPEAKSERRYLTEDFTDIPTFSFS